MFGTIGARAEGIVATAVCTFSNENECIIGTAIGDVTVWRGKKSFVNSYLKIIRRESQGTS